MKRILVILGVLATMFGLSFNRAIFDVFTAQAAGFNDISGIDAVKTIQAEKDVLVLDVRTPGEYAEGHIKGARLIPVDELSRRSKEIESYKKKKVLVICRSGVRSRQASGILAGAGFEQIYNVVPGMIGVNQIPGAPIER